MKMWQLAPYDSKHDFLSKTPITAIISAVLVIASILLVVTVGPKYGIDFRGGTEMILHFNEQVSDDDVRNAATSIGLTDASVQRYGALEDNRFLVQTQAVSVVNQESINAIVSNLEQLGELQRWTWEDVQPDRLDIRFAQDVETSSMQQAALEAGIDNVDIEAVGQAGEALYVMRFQDLQRIVRQGFKEQFGDAFDISGGLERLETVGPRVGEQLRNDGILSVIVALMAILFYIWMRFDIRYSPGAVVALAHDIVIALGAFTALQMEISLPVIAAFLTIVGYSLNDTIVIFDRIRENLESAGSRSVRDIVNQSLNETLSRTVVTSLTTLLAVLSIAILGAGMIQNFAWALVIGILVGTYSSMFIACPIMVRMDTYLRERKKAQAILDAAEKNGTIPATDAQL